MALRCKRSRRITPARRKADLQAHRQDRAVSLSAGFQNLAIRNDCPEFVLWNTSTLFAADYLQWNRKGVDEIAFGHCKEFELLS
jgi:hypothetical protein